ncbi:hypothetical protein WDU94_006832 [Cyamophila willieti]
MNLVSVCCLVLVLVIDNCASEDEGGPMSADRQELMRSLEEMEKNLPTMDYNDKEGFERYIQNLTAIAMENDTNFDLPHMRFINRTVDDELYRALHNVRIRPDPACYPPGFNFANYSGFAVRGEQHKPNEREHVVNPDEEVDMASIMREIEQEEGHAPGKRKRRNVPNKEEQTNQILRDMIVDDEYHQQINELKNKIKEKPYIKNYLYFNFENKDWYKRYKRDLTEAMNELTQDINNVDLFHPETFKNTLKEEERLHRRHRNRRDLTNYEQEKNDFTKQLEKFEINQANIRSLIDKGIGLNMEKAMKLSVDYAQKAYVNTSSSLDVSVQRFFILKQEYMNLIDKWYHGVVIDLPNYLKSQERKKINLSFDDDQPTDEERAKLNKLNEYERIVDREFAEVGIHYGKTLLNNYCDMDDLFYKYHRENNQCDIKEVFNDLNTKELLRKEKITVASL